MSRPTASREARATGQTITNFAVLACSADLAGLLDFWMGRGGVFLRGVTRARKFTGPRRNATLKIVGRDVGVASHYRETENHGELMEIGKRFLGKGF